MKKRCFIAINLPKNIKEKIKELLLKLHKENLREPIKWVRPEGVHLTLHFLGSIEEAQIEKIKKILRDKVGKYSFFNLTLRSIGAFPNLKQPRVIFIEAKENDSDLINLVKEIRQNLEKSGFRVDERPFRLHLTLGRVKGRARLKGIDHELNGKSWKVESIELMESKLTPNGAKYNVVESYRLKSLL